jgi:hypothetical protein
MGMTILESLQKETSILKGRVFILLCIALCVVPMAYFVFSCVSIVGMYLTLSKVRLSMDSTMNIFVNYQGGQAEIASLFALLFGALATVVFVLLVIFYLKQ